MTSSPKRSRASSISPRSTSPRISIAIRESSVGAAAPLQAAAAVALGLPAAYYDGLLAGYRDFYAGEPFVHVTDGSPATKATLGSNAAHVTVRYDERTNTVFVQDTGGRLDDLIQDRLQPHAGAGEGA